jgi:hypothetical protein
LLLILAGSRAPAQTAPLSEKVILLQSTTASPLSRRSMARIRDELSADRFDVIVADASAAGDPGAVIEGAAPLADVGTVLVLFGEPESGQTELCVVRRGARRTGVRRATIAADDPERLPELLAKRALELLRATALELSIEVEPAPRADDPGAGIRAGATPKVLAPEAASVVVDMGVAMWNSVEGPPPAVAPVGRVALRLSDWIWARASVAGLGSRPHVDTAYGSASLSQTVALLECAAIFRRDKRIRPAFSVGAGAVNVQVAGTGAAPYEGRETQRWSVALDGGAGAAFAVGARSALVAELHALVASPHPVIRFVDTRAATVAYPSLILTLALRVAP